MDTINVEKARKCIAHAKSFLDKTKPHYDPELAVFILRDEPIVEDAGLKNLFWTMYRDCSLSQQDVLYAIDKLEQYLVSLIA